MELIQDYQLFLFDFDGILVNTEELHFRAYLEMCSNRGFHLNWDQKKYLSHALYSATAVKEGIYHTLPALKKQEPCWDVLYGEKKKVYYALLQSRGPQLMPGVEKLLLKLEASGVKRCVVTHSPNEQITWIRKQHPILNTIPLWITREDYHQPKPSSECYQKAIHLLKEANDRIIGFEDSPRGLQALLGTEAEGVLISEIFDQNELQKISEGMPRPFSHFRSFEELLAKHSG
jgi:beta-phosphoglucomutase